MTGPAWTVRLALVRWAYRHEPHQPGDPICAHTQPGARRVPLVRGVECRPCARRRRVRVLMEDLGRG